MKVIWEGGWSETTDGKDARSRVITLELGRFVLSLWVGRVKK